MKIAIIGGGLCGVATAWHLLNHDPGFPELSITLFDSHSIGAGASGIAAGLFHPFTGAHSKLNILGREGVAATLRLIQVASAHLDQNLFPSKAGILRLALSDDQKRDYFKCASQYKGDVIWYSEGQMKQLYPFFTTAPGIWIKDGFAIQTSLYLRGLWNACQKRGAIFVQQHIASMNEVDSFDHVIFTIGPQTKEFPFSDNLRLSLIKGQILEVEWPEPLTDLSFPVNSQAYILRNPKSNTYLIGATYEKNFTSPFPDLTTAVKDIMPKAVAMIPSLASAKVIQCFAGVRVATPQHMPLIYRFCKKGWVLTGMGSKGLLYHGLFAEKLVSALASSEG